MNNVEQKINEYNVGKNTLSVVHLSHLILILGAVLKIFHWDNHEYLKMFVKFVDISQEIYVVMLFFIIFSGVLNKKEYYSYVASKGEMFKSKLEFAITSKGSMFELMTYVLVFISGSYFIAIGFLIVHIITTKYYWKNYDLMKEMFVNEHLTNKST